MDTKETKPKKVKAKRRKDRLHYVDNEKFFVAICEHLDKVKEAKAKNEPLPQVSDYIGICIMKIANKLANRPNFANYPFREEMIADAVENCLMYLNNFDPEKSKNPFAYYTQISWYAFVRRIDKEQAYLYTKYSNIKKMLLHDIHEEDKIHITKYGSDYSDELMNEFMDKFEKRKAAKRAKNKKAKKVATIDCLFEEDKNESSD